MSFIEVEDLCKTYFIAQRSVGVWGSIKSLFRRTYREKKAVSDISFRVERGEAVGYIGPNGAGKSTTIKMLSGVLVPTSGTVHVGGVVPYKERKENAQHIGVVFGQRSQLYWDLPVSDTFELYEKLYDIPREVYMRNRDYYTELFQMEDFIDQPVRQLSLGQKMKANIAIALLHDPEVLYLDEPTIGLDVMSKKVLRESIRRINQEKGMTIILTTHDMDDIEAVCSRLILIDQGRKLFDGTLSRFKEEHHRDNMIKLEFKREMPEWKEQDGLSLAEAADSCWRIRVKREAAPRDAVITLLNLYNPDNIYMEEPKIEEIVESIFVGQ